MPTESSPPLLLCVDLEAGSDRLVAYAARHARRCGQAVRVLYVGPAALDGERREAVRQRLHALIDVPLQGIELAGVDIAEGVAEEIIVQTAARRGADPILLGRRRRSTVERIYVGSTTSAVISLARRPVLVVPVDGAPQVQA